MSRRFVKRFKMTNSNSKLTKILSEYNYVLPQELIAKEPARPRDSAKLLVYSRKNQKISIDKFYNIDKYLPRNSILVMNNTKVIPARFLLKKETGGVVEAFYIRTDYDKIVVLLNKKVNIGTRLYLSKKITFEVMESHGKYFYLSPNFDISKIFQILEKFGSMPIPKYIKGEFDQKKLKTDYQSVFAKKEGSVAAPTASLHFTNRLLSKLKRKEVKSEFVTLHVNEGTFAPIKKENLESKKLHEEYYEIKKSTEKNLNHAKTNEIPIIAVGTTVTRTLESSVENGLIKTLSGTTSLFIQEKDTDHFTDGLITNFHLPQSSLMMLVASFIGRKKLLELYDIAIRNNFKFYSFGDAMLIL